MRNPDKLIIDETDRQSPVRAEEITESFKKRLNGSHWLEEKIKRTYLLRNPHGGLEFNDAQSAGHQATNVTLAEVNRLIKQLTTRAKEFGVLCPDNKVREIEEVKRTKINPWEKAESPSWVFVVTKT